MSVANKSKSILFIGWLPPYPGGPSIACSQLLTGLCRSGHRVRALSPIADGYQDPSTEQPLEFEVNRYSVPHYDIAPYKTPLGSRFRQQEHDALTQVLQPMIELHRPDVLLIGHENFVSYITGTVQSRGLPCIQMIMGSPTWQILEGVYDQRLAGEWIEHYRCVGTLVSVSRFMAQGLAAKGLENVHYIPNSVDTERFHPQPRDQGLMQQLGISDDVFVVMHISNMQERKRPMDLVLAAELFNNDTQPPMFVFVGEGPLTEALRQAVSERRLEKLFRFTGWIDHQLMHQYVNLADAVVMPSEGEGLSGVYLETLACGRVLIASDIVAARDVITHGESGLMFGKADIVDLYQQIRMTASDTGLRHRIGDKALLISQQYSVNQVVAQYRELIANLTG